MVNEKVTTPLMPMSGVKRGLDNQLMTPQSMKKLQFDAEKPFSSTVIMDRIRNLFPEHSGVLCIPCKSARLFACFTLAVEKSSNQLAAGSRESRRSGSAKHVKPILAFLSSLVDVEQTSLGRDISNATVHFSGFDCSSTPPPVDSLRGSEEPWEASIEALARSVDQARELMHCGENEDEVVACLQSLVTFLQEIETDKGKAMREECSRTMPSHWPEQRFIPASHLYRGDFEKLLDAIQNGPSLRTSPLSVERQLGDFLGQSIRFYLRGFLNPEPWKMLPGKDVEQASSNTPKRRSRVSEMLMMALPANKVVADSAVADGAISSVFSMALQVVYCYFGSEAFMSDVYCSPILPDGFCQSSVSRRVPQRSGVLTAEDVLEVVTDVQEAQSFLDAAGACRFLSDLMNFPGIREEIGRAAGWGFVENHAKRILRYDLARWCPDDAHLVVLSDAERLFRRIDRFLTSMELLLSHCEASLKGIAVRFNCDARKNRKRNKELLMIASAMEEGESQFVFPSIVPLSSQD